MSLKQRIRCSALILIRGHHLMNTDFVQQIPQTDELGDYEYYRYGYVAPVNDAELRENGELVIYTINYFDGSTGYRIYGSASGAPAGFYACDKDGNIEGRVAEVAVKWDKNKYNPVLYDRQQRLVPQLQGDFDYDGEEVYAYVTVSSKTEEEAETEAELAETEEEAKIATDAPAAKVAAAPRASTYTYDQAVEEIKKYTKTSGSKPGGGSYGTGVPGTWKDYNSGETEETVLPYGWQSIMIMAISMGMVLIIFAVTRKKKRHE